MIKTLLTVAAFLAAGASMLAQQQVSDEISMTAGYVNRVFYNLENQEKTSFNMTEWDIAFYRDSPRDIGIKINDAKNLIVYEVGPISAYGTVTIDNQTSWTALYNSPTDYTKGAFDQGSADYGWGNYDMATHKVMGTQTFIIKKTGTPTEYTKIKINEAFGGYNFTYAQWNGTAWGADVTKVIANTTNPTKFYNYYSFATQAEVIEEPNKTEWDLLFTKYTDLYTNEGDVSMQVVNGVITNPNVKVAQSTESIGNFDELSSEMNVIGYDWKYLDYTTFQYVVNTDTNFFIKRNSSDVVYKVNFTAFEGTSTGKVKFNVDNTATLSVQEVAKGVAFDIYPNPSTDKQIHVVYDVSTSSSAQNTINIYSLTGAKVFSKNMVSQFGFYDQVLDLSRLSSGVYLLEFKSGEKSQTKKIVLK